MSQIWQSSMKRNKRIDFRVGPASVLIWKQNRIWSWVHKYIKSFADFEGWKNQNPIMLFQDYPKIAEKLQHYIECESIQFKNLPPKKKKRGIQFKTILPTIISLIMKKEPFNYKNLKISTLENYKNEISNCKSDLWAFIFFWRCKLLRKLGSCPRIQWSSLRWLRGWWFRLSEFIFPVNEPVQMHKT